MDDVREQILLRLLAILTLLVGTGPAQGLMNAVRDRGVIPPFDQETKLANLPAAVLLDGKEDVRVKTLGKNPGGMMPPTVMALYPQVFVILMPRSNVTNEGVGEELSSWRVKVLRAILYDTVLQQLLGPNGEIAYLGCATDMQTGSTMEGQIQLDFVLTYTFDPNDLLTA